MLMIESNRFCLFSLGSAYVKFDLWSGRNLEMKNRVYAQRQTLVWTTNQIFPLFIVYCSFCLLKNLKVLASFIYENCFGQFLFAYFLFWEISLPIMELVLCRKNCHWTFFVCYPIEKADYFFSFFRFFTRYQRRREGTIIRCRYTHEQGLRRREKGSRPGCWGRTFKTSAQSLSVRSWYAEHVRKTGSKDHVSWSSRHETHS